MKLPRDLSAADLEKALRRGFGYEFSRQVGSHRRLTTQTGGQHHLTIPTTIRFEPERCAPFLVKSWSITV
jgi:predicted RNA binding protein YcfA (HicA-like mRNA interferase family)